LREPSPGSRGYPRPQLTRQNWQSLNGPWDFAIDRGARWKRPEQVRWDAVIQVPFSPEAPASGIRDSRLYSGCWYRRTFEASPPAAGDRLVLHFGAVDYLASVWINGSLAVTHEGGYTPFEVDITELLVEHGSQLIVVRAEDDPNDLAKPRGKQDWQLEPHSIWYPRTTGIWQTVWFEWVPSTHLCALRWTASLTHWGFGLEAFVNGEPRDDLRLSVRLKSGGTVVADDTYAVIGSEVHRLVALSDPGIDDYRNQLLWSPSSPKIVDAELRLCTGSGEAVDAISSYTALREIELQGNYFVLNGRPFPLRFVLDQGYWPEGGLTAPDDAALRRDVELAKAMGFNGVRKHQKIEDPRYLYWADRLGLLVWEEMPSAYRYTSRSIRRLTQQWAAAIDRDSSHPCIAGWVPFNESWGVPNLPGSPAQRHYVEGLYHLTKTLDPTRPVIGNDGWESLATDILGIHDYESDPALMANRYGTELVPRWFRRERPGGRAVLLSPVTETEQPVMLTEFGGAGYSAQNHDTWGYVRFEKLQDFIRYYCGMMDAVRSMHGIAGWCYTQFADTYQEANGLLYADRTPKFPLDQIRAATCGRGSPEERQSESDWRQRLMNLEPDRVSVPEAKPAGTDEGR
jgi:beta-galactosidase/beta-glucuronidase